MQLFAGSIKKAKAYLESFAFFLIFKAARTDASLENGLPVIHFKKILLQCLKQKKKQKKKLGAGSLIEQ